MLFLYTIVWHTIFPIRFRYFFMLKTIVIVLVASFVIVLVGFAGLGVKILMRKHGEFKRHCSSMDPYTGKSAGCACAAKRRCDNDKHAPYQPLEVNKELLNEAGTN